MPARLSSLHTCAGTRDCHLEIKGADAAADLLQGGINGRYELVGCFEGKPMYNRVDGPPGGEAECYADDRVTAPRWVGSFEEFPKTKRSLGSPWDGP